MFKELRSRNWTSGCDLPKQGLMVSRETRGIYALKLDDEIRAAEFVVPGESIGWHGVA
jgi:hypothetical protein